METVGDGEGGGCLKIDGSVVHTAHRIENFAETDGLLVTMLSTNNSAVKQTREDSAEELVDYSAGTSTRGETHRATEDTAEGPIARQYALFERSSALFVGVALGTRVALTDSLCAFCGGYGDNGLGLFGGLGLFLGLLLLLGGRFGSGVCAIVRLALFLLLDRLLLFLGFGG